MQIVFAILSAFVVTFILLPVLIKVSRSIDLLDNPDRRKIHSISTPSLGGVAIYMGFALSVLITVPFHLLTEIKFILFGTIIMLLLGVRDDVASVTAKHKLAIQLFCALIVVYLSDIRLTGFYGLMGIYEMPMWFNIPFSIFVIVALTNSYNLIDGIDGLAGSVGILILGFFGWAFLAQGELAYAVMCISLVGSLFAFLYFNWFPSKVFMGDTGSLVLGFIVSSMAIHFINVADGGGFVLPINASVGVGMSLLVLPIFDTLRVFAIRFYNGKNPLDPDRNHLHHGLLKLGMNHAQATITLVVFNLTILGLSILLNNYLKNGELIIAIASVVLVFLVVFEIRLSKLKHLKKQVTKPTNFYISKSA
ncbi:glycosyltransferase family 4 protein [Marinoscillum sp.]|uniref:glycosyltransferase family 4 protein n=1 Tax=Marinoscillum sp. TaxID=2024838 RepID=UPI003BACB9A9